jgi:2'-5' RNA ligase
LKTLLPLILTARISDDDLRPFDLLRQKHFPPDRNHLRAHLTMFHRLPGEYHDRIVEHVSTVVQGTTSIAAEVSGLRHLGAGVAFRIGSAELESIHAELKTAFAKWLGPQDMQKWQPHITIQNKASRAAADELFKALGDVFRPHPVLVIGLDLWRYLGGPWRHEAAVDFNKGSHG